MSVADFLWRPRPRRVGRRAAALNGELSGQRPARGLALLPSRRPRLRARRRRLLRSEAGGTFAGTYVRFSRAGTGKRLVRAGFLDLFSERLSIRLRFLERAPQQRTTRNSLEEGVNVQVSFLSPPNFQMIPFS